MPVERRKSVRSKSCQAIVALVAAAVTTALVGCAEQTPASTGNFTTVTLAPSQGDMSQLLQQEAEKAKAAGRKPFVEFTADWCPPCRAIKEHLSDPRMVDAFDGVHLIMVDVDEWDDKAIESAGFAVNAIPKFFELDAGGKPTGRTITSGVWDEDIPENMAPPLKEFFGAGKLATP